MMDKTERNVKVMKNIFIIDDSALIRRVLSDIINSDKNLKNDRFAVNGLDGLKALQSGEKFDAIILDINMPKMTGLEFLRELNKNGFKEKVIIVSTLAKEGAKETIEALELGAFDFVTKPDSLKEAKDVSFHDKLIPMIYAATGLPTSDIQSNAISEKAGKRRLFGENRKSQDITASGQDNVMAREATVKNLKPERKKYIEHTSGKVGKNAKKLVALACSTGGPKALQYVIPFLPANLDAPVLLVQHMPEGFTASLAKRLDELSRISVKEAEEGDILQKGTVYIARGGTQMRLVEKGKNNHSISVSAEPARNGLKPCADILYESLMRTSFDEITCVVMTGMGADGTHGILQLEQTNKIYVIGQDEGSCTVYGMPKSIAETGAVDEVVSLKKIADAITEHVGVR